MLLEQEAVLYSVCIPQMRCTIGAAPAAFHGPGEAQEDWGLFLFQREGRGERKRDTWAVFLSQLQDLFPLRLLNNQRSIWTFPKFPASIPATVTEPYFARHSNV